MDSVIVGSASSRTFPVNYAIMPEAMTYGRAEGSSNVIVTPEAMTYGRAEGSSNVIVTPEAMTYGRGRSVHRKQQRRLPEHFVDHHKWTDAATPGRLMRINKIGVHPVRELANFTA